VVILANFGEGCGGNVASEYINIVCKGLEKVGKSGEIGKSGKSGDLGKIWSRLWRKCCEQIYQVVEKGPCKSCRIWRIWQKWRFWQNLVKAAQGAEESYLTVFLVIFTVQL